MIQFYIEKVMPSYINTSGPLRWKIRKENLVFYRFIFMISYKPDFLSFLILNDIFNCIFLFVLITKKKLSSVPCTLSIPIVQHLVIAFIGHRHSKTIYNIIGINVQRQKAAKNRVFIVYPLLCHFLNAKLLSLPYPSYHQIIKINTSLFGNVWVNSRAISSIHIIY